MGGRGSGGQVVMAWPGLAYDCLDEGNLQITIDFRRVLGEILRRGFGNLNLMR